MTHDIFADPRGAQLLAAVRQRHEELTPAAQAAVTTARLWLFVGQPVLTIGSAFVGFAVMFAMLIARQSGFFAWAAFCALTVGGVLGTQAVCARVRQTLFTRVLRHLDAQTPSAIGGETSTGLRALGPKNEQR